MNYLIEGFEEKQMNAEEFTEKEKANLGISERSDGI